MVHSLSSSWSSRLELYSNATKWRNRTINAEMCLGDSTYEIITRLLIITGVMWNVKYWNWFQSHRFQRCNVARCPNWWLIIAFDSWWRHRVSTLVTETSSAVYSRHQGLQVHFQVDLMQSVAGYKQIDSRLVIKQQQIKSTFRQTKTRKLIVWELDQFPSSLGFPFSIHFVLLLLWDISCWWLFHSLFYRTTFSACGFLQLFKLSHIFTLGAHLIILWCFIYLGDTTSTTLISRTWYAWYFAIGLMIPQYRLTLPYSL